MTRFVVVGVTGYSLKHTNVTAQPKASFSVLDSCWNYREVASFYAGQGARRTDAQREAAAHAEAARLEALYGGE